MRPSPSSHVVPAHRIGLIEIVDLGDLYRRVYLDGHPLTRVESEQLLERDDPSGAVVGRIEGDRHLVLDDGDLFVVHIPTMTQARRDAYGVLPEEVQAWCQAVWFVPWTVLLA